jgi:hypothetical protein
MRRLAFAWLLAWNLGACYPEPPPKTRAEPPADPGDPRMNAVGTPASTIPLASDAGRSDAR